MAPRDKFLEWARNAADEQLGELADLLAAARLGCQLCGKPQATQYYLMLRGYDGKRRRQHALGAGSIRLCDEHWQEHCGRDGQTAADIRKAMAVKIGLSTDDQHNQPNDVGDSVDNPMDPESTPA